MADIQDTTGSAAGSGGATDAAQEAEVKAAFARLGIEIDEHGPDGANAFIAALNGVGDQLAVLRAATADIDTLLRGLADRELSSPDIDGAAAVELALRELDARGAEIVKLKADAEKADKAAKAAKAKPAASAPKIRKVAPPKGEHVALAPGDLLELIGAADEVVIVFSDGRQEIAGVPALEVSGDAWKVTGAGLALSGVDVLIHGPAHGQSPYAIHGYGLLLDGEQVAYATAVDVRQVGPHAQVRLSDDIVF